MVLINGLPDDKIAITDRGLQYGDGLFETMVYRAGKIAFIDAHLARLSDGCKRLRIEFAQSEALNNELDKVCLNLAENEAIIKVIITRGSGGRGYFAASGIEPSRIISTHPLPSYPPHYSETGVKVRLCNHTLSENIALAGIKHLNRLDQVLARNEWQDPAIAEGIMLDSSEHVIEGTMSNVFIVESGKLVTPKLDKSGVAGVMRSQILLLARELNIPVVETNIHIDDFLLADEIFLSNSVIGIWPVIEIDNTNFPTGLMTKNLQSALQKVRI